MSRRGGGAQGIIVSSMRVSPNPPIHKSKPCSVLSPSVFVVHVVLEIVTTNIFPPIPWELATCLESRFLVASLDSLLAYSARCPTILGWQSLQSIRRQASLDSVSRRCVAKPSLPSGCAWPFALTVAVHLSAFASAFVASYSHQDVLARRLWSSGREGMKRTGFWISAGKDQAEKDRGIDNDREGRMPRLPS